jgi:hypothetical protein
MLTFKHFVPLLPGKNSKLDYENDPAKGLIKPNLSVLASMTARVGTVLLLPLLVYFHRLPLSCCIFSLRELWSPAFLGEMGKANERGVYDLMMF